MRQPFLFGQRFICRGVYAAWGLLQNCCNTIPCDYSIRFSMAKEKELCHTVPF